MTLKVADAAVDNSTRPGMKFQHVAEPAAAVGHLGANAKTDALYQTLAASSRTRVGLEAKSSRVSRFIPSPLVRA